MCDIAKVERTGAHSHISGLGTTILSSEDDDTVSSGMFGQIEARKAAAIIVEMVKNHKIAGRAVMFAGPSGTGKTAIAHGIANSLGQNIPFASISASEVYSMQMNKTESLTQAVRKAVRLRFKEQSEVLEGEVVKFEVVKKKNSIEGAKLTMKTLDMEGRFDLGHKVTELLIKEKVVPGDIISIEKDGSSFDRIGKSFIRATDFDALDPKIRLVQCPEGELSKVKDVSHVLTMHDMDVGNSRSHGFLALYNGETGEISPEKRNAVNDRIQQWIGEGKAELVPGVLFIDEVHLLDIECFSFLNREMEKDFAPLFIFATNRGISQIRGCEYYAPHGVPQDLLDRMMIIPTNEYTKPELNKIVQIRIVEEGCDVTAIGLEILTNIAFYKSLRYALNLLPVADMIAERRHATMIDGQDLRKAYDLFIDETRSAEYMDKMADEFTKEYDDEDDEDSELISLDILPLIPSWGSSNDEKLLNVLGGLQKDSEKMEVNTVDEDQSSDDEDSIVDETSHAVSDDSESSEDTEDEEGSSVYDTESSEDKGESDDSEGSSDTEESDYDSESCENEEESSDEGSSDERVSIDTDEYTCSDEEESSDEYSSSDEDESNDENIREGLDSSLNADSKLSDSSSTK